MSHFIHICALVYLVLEVHPSAYGAWLLLELPDGARHPFAVAYMDGA